ncbi:acyltransferase [Mycetocola manganoxydans]|uniref:Acyltransferase n=2 Tax=Mycetocola manganoxydans TaxID=699879 RepID=A0A3L7A2P6_9MICO|nr:acyltransferase [Mycetocola manganoxydans]GHD42597.1 acyltransferase [Mycetocola manganoxydans]
MPFPAPERKEVTRPPRLDSLTGLRWWAAFAVFAHHMSIIAPLPGSYALSYGSYGVTFFFILSGFVLTWSARKTVTTSTFYWRRFARIYPSHFIALLLAIPVFYSFSPAPEEWWVKPVSVGILALSFVLLQGWSHDPVILFSGNPAAWTLTCEAFFYALHPAINRVFGKLRVKGSLILVGAVIGAAFLYRFAVMFSSESWLAAAPLPIVRLSEFVIGIGIARAMLAGWRVRLSPVWCYLGVLLLVGWFAISIRWSGNSFVDFLHATANEWIIVAFAATIAAVASSDLTGKRSLLRWRPFVLLGEWSYAFYLVHATVIYALLAVVGVQPKGWSNLLWYAGLLVVTVAAAAALHYLVERPCERFMRSWWDRRLARRTQHDASKPADVVPVEPVQPGSRS